MTASAMSEVPTVQKPRQGTNYPEVTPGALTNTQPPCNKGYVILECRLKDEETLISPSSTPTLNGAVSWRRKLANKGTGRTPKEWSRTQTNEPEALQMVPEDRLLKSSSQEGDW